MNPSGPGDPTHGFRPQERGELESQPFLRANFPLEIPSPLSLHRNPPDIPDPGRRKAQRMKSGNRSNRWKPIEKAPSLQAGFRFRIPEAPRSGSPGRALGGDDILFSPILEKLHNSAHRIGVGGTYQIVGGDEIHFDERAPPLEVDIALNQL